MSIHDETWDKCYICGGTQTGSNYHQHGIGICTKIKRQETDLDKAVGTLKTALTKAEPKIDLANIGFDNLLSLASAIQAAGGNPILALQDFRQLMGILSQNNISIKAEYHGPRKI